MVVYLGLAQLFFPGLAGLHVSFEAGGKNCLHNTISPGSALTILGILFIRKLTLKACFRQV